MEEAPQPIAIFDFDGTLVESDSFFPFLGFAAGWVKTYAALSRAILLYIERRLKNRDDPAVADPRTFIKDYLLRHTIAGLSADKISEALPKLREWRKVIIPMRATLLEHKAKGHHIVIASGGLDLYLPALLDDIPHDAIICTDIEVKDGVITGVMTNGNCVRYKKAERVAHYMATHGPFGESWGYGNFPHDVPMLELVKHRILV